MQWEERVDPRKMKPVSDAVFAVFREQFSYDKTPLNARVESRKESNEGWTLETITLDAAYNHERFSAFLFLPAHGTPPYQTAIYFPSGDAVVQRNSSDIGHYYEVPTWLSFLTKTGRAVLFPVYDGTFERGDLSTAAITFNAASNLKLYTESVIHMVKDFKRCVDYLETRSDIDTSKLAYYGMSWGGMFGGIIPAVEPRLKASVLLGAGVDPCGRPEACQINYLPRVKIPTLIFVGKYDPALSMETSHTPMFDLLGTPPQFKEMKIYPAAHVPPRNEVIKETLIWLDRYLGPVKM